MIPKKVKQFLGKIILCCTIFNLPIYLYTHEEILPKLSLDQTLVQEGYLTTYCSNDCQRKHIVVEGFGLNKVINFIVNEAKYHGKHEELSQGLRECYQMLQEGYNILHLDALKEALPEILYVLMYKDIIFDKSPRPEGEPNSIVSPGTCDLTQVIRLLKKIDFDVLSCCSTATILCDINSTFTILNEINNTLTTCCFDINNTLTINFNGTFTLLNEINNTLTTCCFDIINTLSINFNGTFTLLNEINNTLTTCCFEINNTLTNLMVTSTCACLTLDLVRAKFCDPLLITQAYFDSFPPGTFAVVSGYNLFAEDITYNGPVLTKAITVAGNDLVLDLGCFTLRQGNANTLVDGIFVNTGLSDVTIRNGIVKDFSHHDIVVNGGTNRLLIQDMKLLNNGFDGIVYQGAGVNSNGTIENIEIMSTGTNTGSTASIGLSLGNCRNYQVDHIRINDNGNVAQDYRGLRLDTCDGCQINDVQINNNIANNLLVGVDVLSSSSGNTLSNIVVEKNQAFGGSSSLQAFLFRINSSFNVLQDCLAYVNTATNAVDGFNLQTASNSNIISRCQAVNNIATGTNAISIVHGFNDANVSASSNSRNFYFDCIAHDNKALASLANFAAFGFDLNTTTSAQIVNCIAYDQMASTTSIGFRVSGGGGNEIKRCQSSHHTIGYRLEPINNENNIFLQNFAGKNIEQYSQFPIGSNQIAGGISGINANLTNPWTNVAVG